MGCFPKADGQDTAAQVKTLRLAGCKRIFEEKALRWPLGQASELSSGRLVETDAAEFSVPIGRLRV